MVRRTVLPGGLRVITESLPTVRSATYRHLGRRRLARRVARTGRLLALPRAPAVQGHAAPRRVRRSPRHRRRRRRNQRLHRQGVHLLLRAGARRRRAARRGRLCDMVTSSLVNPTDVDSERGVILEEIAMHDDDPSDAVHDAVRPRRVRRRSAWPPRSSERRLRSSGLPRRTIGLLPAALPARRPRRRRRRQRRPCRASSGWSRRPSSRCRVARR